MGGARPDMARRKRLRSSDRATIDIQSDEDEEGKKMSGSVNEVKNRKTSTAALLERGRQKEGRTNSKKNMMADDQEKEDKMTNWNAHNKVKSRKKVSIASLEKTKEKLCDANNKKKMKICDDKEGKNRITSNHKLKNRKESTTLCEKEKDKQKINQTRKEKTRAADSKGRKILSGHNRVQKSGELSTAFFGKEKERKTLNKTINDELQSDEDDQEEVWKNGSKVKNGKVDAKFSEEEKRKKRPNNTDTEKGTASSTPAVKEKRKRPSESTEMMMFHGKPNQRNVLSNVSKEKKMDTSSGSNYKKKKREEPQSLSKKEKERKTLNKTINEELQSDEDDQEEVWKNGSKVKIGKVDAKFSEEEKRKKRPNNTDTEKGTEPSTPAVKKKRKRPSESTEMMMFHSKPNQRNVLSNVSKEKKMDTSSGSNYNKKKREEPQSLSKKEKRVRCDDNDKKIHCSRVQENKICGSDKEKNSKAPFAFFKFIYNYFEEFLLIPPAVAPKLENLANQDVYLEDSEERRSKVRLSMVDGSLAFHQGWSIFVSDHLIKQGEFLVFQYIAKKIFSVRVFGIDSRERLYFKKGSKRVEHGVGSGAAQKYKNNEILINKQCKTKDASPLRSKEKIVILISDSGTGTSAPNEDVVNLTTSDADSRHHVTINTNKDLERVGVGNLPDVECGTKCISPTCSERKPSSEITATDATPLPRENEGRVGHELEVDASPLRSKEKTVILISVSGTGTSAPNEDIINLTTSDADSRHHVTINTNKDSERVDVGNLPDVPDVECGTKCISPTCSERKPSSEITVTDAAPLPHENEGRVGHELDIHDLGDNLTGKQGINSIPLDSITFMEKHQDNSETNISENFYTNYAAPGGFRCLEKWSNGIVNSRAALDGTVLIEPEKTWKNGSKLVDGYGSIGLNTGNEYFCSEGNHTRVLPVFTVPVKEPSSAVIVSECRHGRTEIDHNINEKGAAVQIGTQGEELEPVESCRTEIDHNVNGEGTIVQLGTKLDQVKPVGSSVCSDSSNVAMYVNHPPEHFISEQEDRKSINCVTMESLLPIEDEIELEVHDLDDNLTGKQEINSILLDSITSVEKHQNNSETNISQNFYTNYAAPGGFRCLEKWSQCIANSRAAFDGTVLVEPEKTRKNGSKLVDGNASIGLNTGNEYFCSEGNHTRVLPVFTMPVKEPLSADGVSKYRHGGTEIDHNINEKGGGSVVQIETQVEQLEPVVVSCQRNNIPVSANTVVLGTIVQFETKLDHVEPVGSTVCSKSSNIAMYDNHVSEHFFSEQEGRKSINCGIMDSLLPMKDKVELDGDSLLKFSLQLCVPDTTRKWLGLPKSLSDVFKQKRHDHAIILLKDPMKRLWPVRYHENPVFVGFTAGWKHFVAGNNLQAGDLCNLIKQPDDDGPVYTVQITKTNG